MWLGVPKSNNGINQREFKQYIDRVGSYNEDAEFLDSWYILRNLAGPFKSSFKCNCINNFFSNSTNNSQRVEGIAIYI